MASSNRITNVAIVGASGNIGSQVTKSLLKTGKHIVTAISRLDSQSKFPAGVVVKRIDHKPETIVEALRGQDALVIALSGQAPRDTEMQLIKAAGEAGVAWILPNEWGPDTAHDGLVNDVAAFQPKVATRKAIEDLGKSSYIAISTGFWYEWSLVKPAGFGFDFANRTANFFDEGETKISTSTLPQVGSAVAALLSLPVHSSSKEACLEALKNKVVYVNSFTVSQKDMFESVLRVTGTKEDDWVVTKEPAWERFASGLKEIKEGKFSGYTKLMTRVFYPDGCGDFEHHKGTLNSLLDLPKEDIDEATKVAIKRSNGHN